MKNSYIKSFLLQTSLILFSLYGGCSGVLAQTDSLTVVNAKWAIKKVASGVWLKQAWFNQSLFNSNQNISILEVRLNGRNHLDVAAEFQELKKTSAFGTDHKALAALNGTFFDMKNGGSVDYIRIDGQVLNENRKNENGKRLFHQNSAVVINGRKLSIES